MTDKVRIQRFPGPMGPVVGPSLIVLGVDKAANMLASSGFMRPWIEEQIRAKLLSGETFKNVGQSRGDWEEAVVVNGESTAMAVRSEWRIATQDEVLAHAELAQVHAMTGRKMSAKVAERTYTLMYHEGVSLIQKYEELPRQAKVILDSLNESGRETFTEASIELILAAKVEELRTRQAPMSVFNFYRKRFTDEGHLVEAEE
jgi:hypothetical protein